MPARIFGLRFSIFYAFLTIGNGMQLPFLPLWLHAKGLTVAEIALVIACMTASRFGAIPLSAYFAGRFLHRPPARLRTAHPTDPPPASIVRARRRACKDGRPATFTILKPRGDRGSGRLRRGVAPAG